MSTETGKRGRSGQGIVIVDLGNEWLKVMRVVREDKGLSLAALAVERADASGGLTPERIAEAVRRVGGRGLPLYGCLARQFATIRTIDLPSTDPGELADMVDLQVGKLTPYAKDEIVTEHKIVGPAREGYTRVLIVIVQRSVLRNRFSLLAEAGLNLRAMSIGTEGILHWMRKAFPAAGAKGAVAVLDVDDGASDCLVVAGNQLLFTRSILVGAAQWRDDEAARERLVRDVANALQAFTDETGGGRPERLLLTGAGPRAAGLDELLRERLDLPVETADAAQLFRRLPKQPALDSAAVATLSLTPLIGMAINPGTLQSQLVPDSVRTRAELVMRARRLATLGALTMTLLVALSLWGTSGYFLRRDRLARTQAEVEAAQAAVRGIEQRQKLIEVIRERSDPRLALVNLLADVQRILPDPARIIVDAIDFDGERQSLQLNGSGASQREVGDLVRALEESPLLRDVREDGTTVREATGRYRFRVVCRLEVSHGG